MQVKNQVRETGLRSGTEIVGQGMFTGSAREIMDSNKTMIIIYGYRKIDPHKWNLMFLLPGFIFMLAACGKQDLYENPLSPIIESIYPEQGKAATTLYIYGRNFSPAISDNRVRIGNKEIAIYKSDSASIMAIIPPGLMSGNVQVEVRNKAVMGPYFTYLPTVIVGTFSGSGLIGSEDGSAGEARFNTPRALAIDGSGNLFLADQMNHSIRKITPDGRVSTLAGDGTEGFADGSGAQARFRQPVALVVNADGNLYVADFGNHAIRKVSMSGAVTTIAGDSLAGYSDGTGKSARFNGPSGIVSDQTGTLYVADFFNNVIRQVTPAGRVTTYAGTGTAGATDGDRQNCRFTLPAGMGMGPQGNIYVSDWGGFRVRKITPQGIVSTLAGSTQGYADGDGKTAKFNTPYAVSCDAAGNVFVADGFNNAIRQIGPGGDVTTLAGGSEAGYKDGSRENALFNGPVGLVYDTLNNNLYVTGWYNHRVRIITIR